jgi:hypothetical protein
VKKRRTLVSLGRKGQRVRALVDANRGRVEVLYNNRVGTTHKKIWPNTKDGRDAAVLWAETFYRERERAISRTPDVLTHRALWERFVEAPAFRDTRAATQDSYRERWGMWTARQGLDTDCNAIELEDIDLFITRMRDLPTRHGGERSINQVRQVINTVRTIFNWGQSRKLLRNNVFVGYRWKQPRDARPHEPEEYTPEEYAKLVNGVSPQDGKRWRLHVMLVLAGVHGSRANAVRHLRWASITDVLQWDRDYQKTGESHEQPLTWELIAALETAKYWTGRIPGRRVERMSAKQRAALEAMRTSPWVLPGFNKAAKPWGYQAMWLSLRKLETEVGVEHKPYRAMHGLRKQSAGTVADQTGDDRLGMEWIGDRDMKQKRAYLKRRRERMERAATAAASGRNVPRSFPNDDTANRAGVKAK